MNDIEAKIVQGAYWGTASLIDEYRFILQKKGCACPLARDNKVTGSLSRVRTRLNHFNSVEQEQLIDWGYALTDAAMRCYILKKKTRPGRLPYPDRLIQLTQANTRSITNR